jgi:hypothetical protein
MDDNMLHKKWEELNNLVSNATMERESIEGDKIKARVRFNEWWRNLGPENQQAAWAQEFRKSADRREAEYDERIASSREVYHKASVEMVPIGREMVRRGCPVIITPQTYAYDMFVGFRGGMP